MREDQARELMKKYREGTLSGDERALLESWYLELARSKELKAGPERIAGRFGESADFYPPAFPTEKKPVRPLIKWGSVAAVVAALLVSGGYFTGMFSKKTVIAEAETVSDALPGDNRALLTLGNGRSISLDEARSGQLAQEGNIAITKTQDGEIVYSHLATGSGVATPVVYNKIETPKAGQYSVTLPDGTQAWLNAASSIRFPTVFPDTNREVHITGEVYFEVAKVTQNKRRVPFRVYARNQAIEVLGTAFNVNSYDDEEVIKTTLLEGSIRVNEKNRPEKRITLRPGQQSKLATTSKNPLGAAHGIEVSEVNPKAAVAWKEGYFRFDGIGLHELMRQLCRWYDMEVVYEGTDDEYEFVGQIARNSQLSKTLQILEMGGVQFQIKGRTIIVTN